MKGMFLKTAIYIVIHQFNIIIIHFIHHQACFMSCEVTKMINNIFLINKKYKTFTIFGRELKNHQKSRILRNRVSIITLLVPILEPMS